MTKERSTVARALAMVAASPFVGVALLHCARSTPAPPMVDAGSAVARATVDVPTKATDVAVASDPPPGPVMPPPRPRGPFDGPACVALRAEYRVLLEAHAACAKDGDCVEVRGADYFCGAAVNGAFTAQLEAKAAAYDRASCDVGAPMPSCAPRGRPKCVGGKCELPRPE